VSTCCKLIYDPIGQAYRSGKGSSNDFLRPRVFTRTVTMMMSSGERSLLEFHSNVTLEPNGIDLVEGCVGVLLVSSEWYGGGGCWALYGGGLHSSRSEVRNRDVPGSGWASRGEQRTIFLGLYLGQWTRTS